MVFSIMIPLARQTCAPRACGVIDSGRHCLGRKDVAPIRAGAFGLVPGAGKRTRAPNRRLTV